MNLNVADASRNLLSEMEGSIARTTPLLPKAFVRVLAKVLAGIFVMLQRYAGWLLLQLFVAYASGRETSVSGRKLTPLIELGRLFGIGDPLPAQRAELIANVQVKLQGGELPAGTPLISQKTRICYVSVYSVPLNASSVSVRLRAASSLDGGDGSGVIGNLQTGDVLAFANTPANLLPDVTVSFLVTPGVDAEPIEKYRARVFAKTQGSPEGGALAHYVTWAKKVDGIVNVYPYPGERPGGSGPGQVDVYVEATVASSGDTNGIPTAPQLAAVFDSIAQAGVDGKATRRPVSAAVNVLPISLRGFDVTVFRLVPNTPNNKTAIQAGIEEYLRSREPHIEGLSVLPNLGLVTEAAVAGVVDTVASSLGATIAGATMVPHVWALSAGEKARLATPPHFVVS